jgi:hypothetical protein
MKFGSRSRIFLSSSVCLAAEATPEVTAETLTDEQIQSAYDRDPLDYKMRSQCCLALSNPPGRSSDDGYVAFSTLVRQRLADAINARTKAG